MRYYKENIESRSTARHKACIEFSSDVRNTKLCLDVGCGIGWYENFIVKKSSIFIIGVDLNHNELVKAKKGVSADWCEFVHASANALPFKTGVFDAVSLFDVLEHLPVGSESNFFSGVNRVLKMSGLLVISVPNNNFFSKFLDPAYFLTGHRHYDLVDVKSFMEKSGFDVCVASYGGGIMEALSMIFLYFFKHVFGMEIPFKKLFESLRNREYRGKGFITLFIKGIKKGYQNQVENKLLTMDKGD